MTATNISPMPEEYFAWLDTGEIKNLGVCEGYDEAFEKADALPQNSQWVFSEQGLREMQAEIANALQDKRRGVELNGWLINDSDDGQYIYLQRDGSPGQIHVKAEDEGFVVDIWADDEGTGSDYSVASTSALYTELERE